MITVLLASASPARRATLVSAGITPQVRVSSVDEDAVLISGRERFGELEPADAVLLLAQAKAEDVARAVGRDKRYARDEDAADASGLDGLAGSPDLAAVSPVLADVVVGCDSMLEFDGEILGKPADAATATARWQAMRGRSGTLHTGHWVIDLRDQEEAGTGGTLGASSSTVVHFADVTDEEIAAYVATGEPLAVAGAFTVDGLGGAFVTGIEGDHHGVVGLSLPLLRELLAQLDIAWTDLW